MRHQPSPLTEREPRHHAELSGIVNQGVRLAEREGIGAAIEFMRTRGVDATVTLRVLADPRLHRPM